MLKGLLLMKVVGVTPCSLVWFWEGSLWWITGVDHGLLIVAAAPPQEFFNRQPRRGGQAQPPAVHNPLQAEDALFGAAWSPGIVAAVNEVQVMAKRYDRGPRIRSPRPRPIKPGAFAATDFDTGGLRGRRACRPHRADASPAPAQPPVPRTGRGTGHTGLISFGD